MTPYYLLQPAESDGVPSNSVQKREAGFVKIRVRKYFVSLPQKAILTYIMTHDMTHMSSYVMAHVSSVEKSVIK
jgi:hypothetical protein